MKDKIEYRRIASVVLDFVAVAAGWLCFNVLRFFFLPQRMHMALDQWLLYPQVIIGQVVVPLFMVLIFAFAGCYSRRNVMQQSGADMAVAVFCSTFVGMIAIFFAALINDDIPERMLNYEIMLALWGSLFVPVVIEKLILKAVESYAGKRNKMLIPLLMIGSEEECRVMENELRKKGYPMNLYPYEKVSVDDILKPDFSTTCSAAVICTEGNVKLNAMKVLKALYGFKIPVFVKTDNYLLLELRPRFVNPCGVSLVDISTIPASSVVCNAKRLIDIFVSLSAMLILAPVYGIIFCIVKSDSKGPAIYRQKRLGYHCKEFTIYKFRTMIADAESQGVPRLSSREDERITRTGRVLRKYRLDEIPQFWNVFKGDMSLVGPRPERKYFADKILENNPNYSFLYQTKPGITSLGTVKFGYASTIDQMLKRMEYDLIYMQNISLSMDLKVLFYTVKTVVKGKGI